jgi:hypothetical protein
MSAAVAHGPILIDEPALHQLAQAGYRWKDGQIDLVRYRWLLPPDWVLATDLPARPRNGIEPLCGAGDRATGLTAVLGVLRGCSDPPHQLVARGAAAGARVTSFTSRSGPVGERVELRDGKTVVTTVHAFSAGAQPYRFFVAALGAGHDPAVQKVLRTIGSALSLAEDLDAIRRGRLHG